MAYAQTRKATMPLPVEPMMLSVYVPNSAAETNTAVRIPWENCRLAHAHTAVATAIDATGAMEIDLELNAAAGTEMMSITVAGSAPVGDEDDASVTTAAACKNLSINDTSRDAINIEVDGSSTGTGAVMLYLYFESERGQ